jgi:hypothetical protein
VPVEQLLRDLRINRIFEGSTEIMHLFVAREAVDAHLSVAGDIIDPQADPKRKARAAVRAGAFYARWLPRLAVGRGQLAQSYSEFGALAGHLRYVERASRKLARSTFYAMARWRGGMERKQAFLARIVDIGAELLAMAASCVRAQMELADDRERGETAYELADVFCRQARQRVDRLFHDLWHNTDPADYRLARRVLDGRYAWHEEGILDPVDEDLPWIAEPEAGPSTSPDLRRHVPPA